MWHKMENVKSDILTKNSSVDILKNVQTMKVNRVQKNAGSLAVGLIEIVIKSRCVLCMHDF